MVSKTKILFLSTTSKIGGAERVLLSLVGNLPPEHYSHFLATQECGPLTEEFLKAGGKIFVLKLPAWRKGKNFINRYLKLRKLIHFVKRNRINLVYANSYRLNPYAFYISKFCGIPSVTHIHDVIIKNKHITNFLLDKSEYLITPSEYVKASLSGISSKIFVVHNGINIDEFSQAERGEFRREFNIEDDCFLVGMVAHFVKRKGHRFFIEAASEVKRIIKNVKFIIIGGDIYGGQLTQKELEEFSRRKGVSDSLIFTGPRKDIPQILKDLDIFVHPVSKESFCLALVEAMASGVPVIVHKYSGGPSEIVENGVDGLMVDCTKTEVLAEAIVKLIRDEELRKRFSRAGYEKVKRQFNINIFIGKIEKIFEVIISRKNLAL